MIIFLRAVIFCGLALAASPASAGLFSPADSVNIGKAQKLALSEPLDQLTKDVAQLHPVAMFFLAHRLFEDNRQAEAAFWYYEGQLRWTAHLMKNRDQMEFDMFERLKSEFGPDINDYAFHDVTAMMKMLDDVLAWDAAHPDNFTPPGKEKDDARSFIAGLKADIPKHLDFIAKHNAEVDARPKPTADDPYPGDGGALFGTPSEMLKPYDAKMFADFKIGVTTKAAVAKAMGKPEWWGTEKDGTSSMGYSFYLATPASRMLGMVQNVTVTFVFDDKKVLKDIRLPKDAAP